MDAAGMTDVARAVHLSFGRVPAVFTARIMRFSVLLQRKKSASDLSPKTNLVTVLCHFG